MWCTLVWIWVIVALCDGEEFSISSTSAPVTEYQKLTNILTKLNEKLELQSVIRETNHRLESLEKQYEQNRISSITISNDIARQFEKLEQKQILERTNSRVANITMEIDKRMRNLELQIAEITRQLGKLEQNQILDKKNSAIANITTGMDHRMRNVELQIVELKNSEGTGSSKLLKTKSIPEDCLEVKERGNNVGGIFLIKPKFASSPFLVVCDMTTRGGGWTLILNRFDGSVDFYLDWQSYKDGFGNLAGEFWLGLENIQHLSGYQVNELLVELDSKETYAHYKHFSLGSEKEGYALKTVGGFSGTAEDSLADHAGAKFTTKDKDQDSHSSVNCAQSYSGGWWYRRCHSSHLTGLYKETTNKYKGVRWGENFFLKKTRMLIRPQLNPAL